MERVLVKQRDRFSIEIKARFLIPQRGKRRATYDLRLYFFFPRTFGIGAATFNADRFYRQLRPYVRFNTPAFTFEELLDPQSSPSPLTRVEQELKSTDAEAVDHERFGHEARMLAMVYKSALRDFLLSLRDGEAGDRTTYATIDSARRVAERFHTVARSIGPPPERDEPDIARAGALIDEHLSLLLEKYLSSFLARADRSRMADSADLALRTIEAETGYRTRRGYPTVLSADSHEAEMEEYVYREKMLKRYASEVLMCSVKRHDTGRTVRHILYAAAAGAAMTVATAIAFLGQTRFGSLTTSLFVVLVVGYMLKDRIKDLFRDLFRRRLARRFHDRRTTVRDPEHRRRIARLSERTSFVTARSIPPAVAKLRDRGWFERALAAFTEESILRYGKAARMDAARLDRLHHRIRGLADITIVDLSPFLAHLSRQHGLVPVLTGEGEFRIHHVRRVYHLNLVIEFSDGERTLARRFRLVVDAGGIERVEPVPTGDEECDRLIEFVGRGAATDELEGDEQVE